MKKRENGFTLIELLAVIIILAAIALIIAPLVLDIIKEQQMKTFKESINGILRSSRLEIVNSGLKFPATFTYQDGKLLSPTGKELKVTGKIPEGVGSVIYYSEDNVELAITDQTWCGTYNKTNKEIEVNELSGKCEIKLPTSEACFTFDSSTGTITEYLKNDSGCGDDVVIPDTIDGVLVMIIGERAFFYKQLTSVDFSYVTSLTTIGKRAFSGNKLTSVDFSYVTNLTMIDVDAFDHNSLTSLVIPGNVKTLGGDDYTSATQGVFGWNPLTSLVIEDGVEFIGAGCFTQTMLSRVEIPPSVTTIRGSAFGCPWSQDNCTVPEIIR